MLDILVDIAFDSCLVFLNFGNIQIAYRLAHQLNSSERGDIRILNLSGVCIFCNLFD